MTPERIKYLQQLAAQAGADYSAQQSQPQQKSSRSLAGALLPAAGAIGAGLIAAPFTGGLSLAGALALAGGAAAAGGAGGELLSQVSGKEKINKGAIAKEGLISGAMGAGGELFGAARAARVAGKAGMAVPSAKAALTSADAYQGLKASAQTARAARGVPKVLDNVAGGLKSNVINPKTQASVFGAGEDKAIVDTVSKYVKGSSAAGKYKNLESAMMGISDDITKTLKPVKAQTTVVDLTRKMTTDLADNINFVPGDTAYEREFARVLNKVGSFGKDGKLTAQNLFDAKQYLGSQLNGAFGKNGADLTVPQQVRMAVWENLDDSITNLAPKVKNLTIAQSRLIQSAKGLQQGANKTVGAPILGLKSRTLSRLGQGAQDFAANRVGNVADILSGGGGMATQALSKTAQQALPRAAMGDYSTNDPMTEPITNMTNDATMMSANNSIDPSYNNTQEMSSIFSPQNLESAIMQIMYGGGSLSDVKELLSVAKAYNDVSGGGKTSNRALTQGQQERADLIKALDLTQQSVDQGSINYGPIGSRVEGVKSFFNAADPETLSYKNTVAGLRAAITKARAGSSLTAGELKLLQQYTPSPTDTEQVVRSKLAALRQLYGSSAPQPSQSGTLESALMQLQGAY